MTTWEQIVQDQIIVPHEYVSALTRPLREHFGVTFFNYHRIDNDGRYSLVLDRPDWAEHYVTHHFFANDPFLQNPVNYQTGSCFLEVNGNEEYQNTVVRDGAEIFGIDTGLVHVYRSDRCVEFYCYSGNSRQSAIKELALNNRAVLLSFEKYFNENAAKLLRENHDQGVNLKVLKGEPYDAGFAIRQTVKAEECSRFLSDLGKEQELRLAASLTPREIECLRYLVEGLTAKETGVEMGISSRTVETYLDQIKKKFNVRYKHQLLPMARQLHVFDLFDFAT